jgi:hypothetical protein
MAVLAISPSGGSIPWPVALLLAVLILVIGLPFTIWALRNGYRPRWGGLG